MRRLFGILNFGWAFWASKFMLNLGTRWGGLVMCDDCSHHSVSFHSPLVMSPPRLSLFAPILHWRPWISCWCAHEIMCLGLRACIFTHIHQERKSSLNMKFLGGMIPGHKGPRRWDILDKSFMQVAFVCCFRRGVAGMSRDLGWDAPDLEKCYARKLWADFSLPTTIPLGCHLEIGKCRFQEVVTMYLQMVAPLVDQHRVAVYRADVCFWLLHHCSHLMRPYLQHLPGLQAIVLSTWTLYRSGPKTLPETPKTVLLRGRSFARCRLTVVHRTNGCRKVVWGKCFLYSSPTGRREKLVN